MSGSSGLGQGGCEWRSEVFVKIQKKMGGGSGAGGPIKKMGGGSGAGVRSGAGGSKVCGRL